MATRRVPYASASDTSSPAALPTTPLTPPTTASNITPAVPTPIILKLLLFTFLMITAPISSYFLSLNTICSGNSTYAGALAAVIANLVLVGYILVAVYEDQGDSEVEGHGERRKEK